MSLDTRSSYKNQLYVQLKMNTIKLKFKVHSLQSLKNQMHVTPTKHVQYLNAENYKTLMKGRKTILSKWRYILCAHTGRPNMVKMSSPLKLLFSFNIIPIKFQQDFLMM